MPTRYNRLVSGSLKWDGNKTRGQRVPTLPFPQEYFNFTVIQIRVGWAFMPTRYNGLVLDSLKWMGIKRVGNKCPPYFFSLSAAIRFLSHSSKYSIISFLFLISCG